MKNKSTGKSENKKNRFLTTVIHKPNTDLKNLRKIEHTINRLLVKNYIIFKCYTVEKRFFQLLVRIKIITIYYNYYTSKYIFL